MNPKMRPLQKCRPRNPEAERLASEIRVMVAAVMVANGWDLARMCVEINLSDTQLRAARKGDCDPRASSFRKLQKLYAALPQKKATGT